jgi:hypothetical protein
LTRWTASDRRLSILPVPVLRDLKKLAHTRAGSSSAVRVEDQGPVQFKTRGQPVRVYSVVPEGP